MLTQDFNRLGIPAQTQESIHKVLIHLVKQLRGTVTQVNNGADVISRISTAEILYGTQSIIESTSIHREVALSMGNICIDASVIQNIKTGRARLYKYVTVWIGDTHIEDVEIREI